MVTRLPCVTGPMPPIEFPRLRGAVQAGPEPFGLSSAGQTVPHPPWAQGAAPAARDTRIPDFRGEMAKTVRSVLDYGTNVPVLGVRTPFRQTLSLYTIKTSHSPMFLCRSGSLLPKMIQAGTPTVSIRGDDPGTRNRGRGMSLRRHMRSQTDCQQPVGDPAGPDELVVESRTTRS